MIITILWEDQRSTTANSFGPHLLLLACLADDLRLEAKQVSRQVAPHPKKGNANVRKAIQQDGGRLTRMGPVFAVIDRDKIHKLWATAAAPPNCMRGIAEKFRSEASGEYDLIFLIDNTESLLLALTQAMSEPPPSAKPPPDARDGYFARGARSSPSVRQKLRALCPSFDRLVNRVVQQLTR